VLLVVDAVLIQQELGAVNLYNIQMYKDILPTVLPCGHFGNILGCPQTSV